MLGLPSVLWLCFINFLGRLGRSLCCGCSSFSMFALSRVCSGLKMFLLSLGGVGC